MILILFYQFGGGYTDKICGFIFVVDAMAYEEKRGNWGLTKLGEIEISKLGLCHR